MISRLFVYRSVGVGQHEFDAVFLELANFDLPMGNNMATSQIDERVNKWWSARKVDYLWIAHSHGYDSDEEPKRAANLGQMTNKVAGRMEHSCRLLCW
jgi:hypothetical protein